MCKYEHNCPAARGNGGGIEFQNTVRGTRFFDAQLPALIREMSEFNKNAALFKNNVITAETIANIVEIVKQSIQANESDIKALNDKLLAYFGLIT